MHGHESERCLLLMMDILKVLKSSNQHEEVFYRTIDLITRVHPVQTIAVVLIDPKTEYLTLASTYGISHEFQKRFRRKISTGSIGELIWRGTPIVIQDAAATPDLAEEVQLELPFGSCLCLPVGANHRSLGYLVVTSDLTHSFDSEDQRFLEACADLMGIAYQKCWLSEENLRLNPIDPETNLKTYAAFQDHVRAALGRGSQFGEPFAVILCDVDNFKGISHTYGYETSRQLLKDLGALVRKNTRPMDASGRFGFDEVIVLREKTGPEEAIQFAESLRRQVEETPLTSQGIRSTISVGVAVFPQNGTTIEDLMISAKNGLFDAQREGRNKVVAPPGSWHRTGERLDDVSDRKR